MNTRNTTSFLPTSFNNAWFMGPTAVPALQGVMNSNFVQFRFTMPTIPSLVGVEFSAQTLLLSTSNVLTITNPDCREVRND